MYINLSYRKASADDLSEIVKLLHEDQFGQSRERMSEGSFQAYIKSFDKINSDPNQYIMVVENQDEVVGTCHLTILHSLTFEGSTRLQIEAVRVSEKHRGQGIGQWMITQAIEYGRLVGASIIQLMSDKRRTQALSFYETLGFEATHEGLKIFVE